MKNFNFTLFLIPLIFLTSLSHAQSKKSFFVGTSPLRNIEAPLIEVKFDGRLQKFSMNLYYGQECARNFYLYRNMKLKEFEIECAGLKDQGGNLIIFQHYLDGLNVLEKEGFELIEIVPFPESMIMNNATFIFRRKSDQKRAIE